MLEGKLLLQSLTARHIPCTYALLPSLPAVLGSTSRNAHSTSLSHRSAHLAEDSTSTSSSAPSVVLLGAHAIHANGSAYARAGTAMVAMMAKERGVPVLVCAETYKFSEGVVLDAFGKNELGKCPLHKRIIYLSLLHFLLLAPSTLFQSTYPSSLTSPSIQSRSKSQQQQSLQLEPQQNLEILSPLYDLTPPANIAAVVTEVGIIPPNSISSILVTLGRGLV